MIIPLSGPIIPHARDDLNISPRISDRNSVRGKLALPVKADCKRALPGYQLQEINDAVAT